MKNNAILLFSFLSFAFLPHSYLKAQSSGIQRVWAVDDGERIKRTVLNHPLRTSPHNSVWSEASQTISLFGGRNEFVAFQLIIEAKSVGATSVNVTLDSLRKADSPSFTIKNTGAIGNPYNYVGKHIEMFVMHYMNVNVRTDASYIWWSGARPGAAGDPYWSSTDFTGWIGEQLVPFEAPAGARTNGQGGAPFTVAASQSQSVWVDVYIPKNAPSGNYSGTLRVTENGVSRYSLPVHLKVYNFTLSDTTHIPNTGYIQDYDISKRHRLPAGYEHTTFHNMIKKYMAFAKRHRLNIQRGWQTPQNHWKYLKDVYTGSYFTSQNGYYGPGEGLPPNLFHIGVFDQPNKSVRNDRGYFSGFGDSQATLAQVNADTTKWRNLWRNASNMWVDSFGVYAPRTIIRKYGPEEASVEGGCAIADTSVFYDMRRKSRWLAQNPGSGAALKYDFSMNFRPEAKTIAFGSSKGTHWIGPGQSGYTPSAGTCPYNPYASGMLLDSLGVWQDQLGIDVGLYGGGRPGWASQVIDAPAIDQRSIAWFIRKHNLRGGFRFWVVNHFGSTTNRVNSWYRDFRSDTWGDGTLIYPGQEEEQFIGDDRGLAGPIAGVRLKNWRRGMQDYEYIVLAQQLGLNTTSVVNSVIKKSFDQLPQFAPVALDAWAQRGYQFENARRQLAELIEEASSPIPHGSFEASPPELTSGPGNSTLTWTSVNATSAFIDHGVGPVPVNGSQVVFVDSTRVYKLTLSNQSGVREYSVTVTVRRLPTGSLDAVPDTVDFAGAQSVLSWTATNALTASIDNNIGVVPLSGSFPISILQNTTYTLTLMNEDGQQTYSKTILLRTLPSGTFHVSPDSIAFDGDDITFTWSTTNATSARLNRGIGTVPLNGSLTLYLSSPEIFTLTLTNPFGSVDYSVQIFQRPYSSRFVSIPPESLVVRDPVRNKIAKPVRRGRGLYPNWVNLLAEVVVQGGFQPGASESDSAGGMRIGISSMEKVSATRWRPRRDSAAVRSWVRLGKWNPSRNVGSSYTAIQSSIEDRSGRHVASPRGFDSTGAPGQTRRRQLKSQFTKLGPQKYNNKLYSELIALKFNIAASQLGKTPPGFGELVFTIDGHPMNNRTVIEIASTGDSMMTYWAPHQQPDYEACYSAVYLINRAFTSPMDTLEFEAGGQLRLKGSVEIGSVPYLLHVPVPPRILDPTTQSLPDDYEEFIDEDFDDEELHPSEVKLYQNYPNPFNPATTLGFRLRSSSFVTLKVYNLLGQEVRTMLDNGLFEDGYHTVPFAADNLASGVYFYRLQSRGEDSDETAAILTGKMLLIK